MERRSNFHLERSYSCSPICDGHIRRYTIESEGLDRGDRVRNISVIFVCSKGEEECPILRNRAISEWKKKQANGENGYVEIKSPEELNKIRMKRERYRFIDDDIPDIDEDL